MPEIRTNHKAPTLEFGMAVHPLVKMIWMDIVTKKFSINSIAHDSGVTAKSLRNWKNGQTAPPLANIEAVLNVLGYEIKVVKAEEKCK